MGFLLRHGFIGRGLQVVSHDLLGYARAKACVASCLIASRIHCWIIIDAIHTVTGIACAKSISVMTHKGHVSINVTLGVNSLHTVKDSRSQRSRQE